MSTEINVTVDSGGLLERSKLQTAANRQAFVEGQQRANAEQTGKEQRLERLAAEGRDAQSNLILPGRARRSALDRSIPQPAARRSGLNLPGLTIFYDRALLQVINGGTIYASFNWTDFLYVDGIKATNLLPSSEFVWPEQATGSLPSALGTAALSTAGYPYKHISMTITGGEAEEKIAKEFSDFSSGSEWTYASDMRVDSPADLLYFSLQVGDVVSGVNYYLKDSYYEFYVASPVVKQTYFSGQGAGWLRFSVTYRAGKLLLHVNGKWVASISQAISYTSKTIIHTRTFQSDEGSSGQFAFGLVRFIPRPLYVEQDYVVTPILKIR